MCLAGAILGTGAHIFVETGATHNIINLNFMRLIDLLKQRINTAVPR